MLIDEEQNARISDFGLACTVGRLQPGLSYLQRLSSSTNNPGAARWAAPEQLSGSKPHPSGDIYSFGCMMFEVITRFDMWATTDSLRQVLSGDIPWSEKTTYQVVALKLSAHKPPSRPICTGVGDKHWGLMVRCWSSAPQLRPTAREVVMVVDMFFSGDTDSTCWYTIRGLGKSRSFFFFFFIDKGQIPVGVQCLYGKTDSIW